VELRSHSPGLLRQGYAGDACNTAIYLARLLAAQDGPQVAWAMGVGEDPFASSMRKFWSAEGLDLSLLRTLSGGRSGLYAIDVDERGERRFSYWRDTSAARQYFETPDLTPLERNADRLQGLHFSAISLAILPPQGRARLMACAQAIRKQGGWVSFDTNYRPVLWESPAHALQAIQQAIVASDRVFVSIDEWLVLTQASSEAEALATLQAFNRPELVIKRGGEHTWLSVKGGPVQVAPVQAVDHAVDTTAAGDAFAAAYLAARTLGLGPLEAAQQGNRLAGAVVMQAGAIMALADMPKMAWR